MTDGAWENIPCTAEGPAPPEGQWGPARKILAVEAPVSGVVRGQYQNYTRRAAGVSYPGSCCLHTITTSLITANGEAIPPTTLRHLFFKNPAYPLWKH